MKIAEFNIRNDCDRNEYSWENRRENFKIQVRELDADIYCFCEVLHNQLLDICNMLNGYEYVGVGRDDGKTNGEYAPVFYNAKKFTLVKSGWFWLSETPDEPSMGWDASYIRIYTYCVFENNESKKTFAVFNTHLDVSGQMAVKKGAEMILKRANEMNLPFVITGDLNINEGGKTYLNLIENGVRDCKYIARKTDAGGTYHGYGYNVDNAGPIDFMLVKEDCFSVESYSVCKKEYRDNIYASDHYPICVCLEVL